MKVITPISIVDNTSIVTSTTNLAEPSGTDPAVWSSGTAYAIGDTATVLATHKIYICITAVTGGDSPEVSVTRAIPKWTEHRYTNKYAMFDLKRSAASVFSAATGSFTLQPGVEVETIAFLGIQDVDTLTVTCTYFNGSTDVTFYAPGTVDLITRTVTGWYEYFFNPFLQQKVFIVSGIPSGHSNMKIKVDITGTTGMQIGSCIIGNGTRIGALQHGSVSDALNFSVINRDSFGSISLVKRRSVPKITGTIAAKKADMAALVALKKALDAKVALWIGIENSSTHPYYEALIIQGFYKEWSFDLSNPIVPMINIELEEI